MIGDVDFDDDTLDDELSLDILVPIDDELEELCEDANFEAVRAAILPVRAVIAKVSRQIMPVQ